MIGSPPMPQGATTIIDYVLRFNVLINTGENSFHVTPLKSNNPVETTGKKKYIPTGAIGTKFSCRWCHCRSFSGKLYYTRPFLLLPTLEFRCLFFLSSVGEKSRIEVGGVGGGRRRPAARSPPAAGGGRGGVL